MSFDQLIYLGLTTFLGIFGYLVKDALGRLKRVEKSLEDKVTEQAVRQIVADKLDPIKEDLDEIKARVNQLLDMFLNDKSKRK